MGVPRRSTLELALVVQPKPRVWGLQLKAPGVVPQAEPGVEFHIRVWIDEVFVGGEPLLLVHRTRYGWNAIRLPLAAQPRLELGNGREPHRRRNEFLGRLVRHPPVCERRLGVAAKFKLLLKKVVPPDITVLVRNQVLHGNGIVFGDRAVEKMAFPALRILSKEHADRAFAARPRPRPCPLPVSCATAAVVADHPADRVWPLVLPPNASSRRAAHATRQGPAPTSGRRLCPLVLPLPLLRCCLPRLCLRPAARRLGRGGHTALLSGPMLPLAQLRSTAGALRVASLLQLPRPLHHFPPLVRESGLGTPVPLLGHPHAMRARARARAETKKIKTSSGQGIK
mmetsp:Transcript_3197/g.8861  ORF Transcript_3197/g.8861 Transcript_3197/m.8861 type:complete len:340 (-) Transcript_3197:2090-3109(-)